MKQPPVTNQWLFLIYLAGVITSASKLNILIASNFKAARPQLQPDHIVVTEPHVTLPMACAVEWFAYCCVFELALLQRTSLFTARIIGGN